MKSHNLKLRVLLTVLVIVTVTSSLFAGGVMFIKARLEAVVLGEMVATQLEALTEQLEQGNYNSAYLFDGWQFYYQGSPSLPPPEITALLPGDHHSIEVGNSYYQVEVGSWQGEPSYLVYDITNWENQEHLVLSLLLYGLILVAFIALLMGLSASKVIIAPVSELSRRITTLHPGERKLRIEKDYRGSEIWKIAAAFDSYMERLDQFVERERSFTAAASHELRTPLSVMMGAVDVLSASELSPAAERAAERINRACKEMLAFIEATLFLSREDDKQITQGPKADLITIIQQQIEDNSAQIEAKNLRIETSLKDKPVLKAPASLVQITFSNLFRNALEHTSQGTISIELNQHKLLISDTGEGIAADKIDQIFDRSYSTKTAGTGLGLNLVRRICDRFDWEISVESTIDVGTKISIEFPHSTEHS
ncbi:MAG: HAMP domain-containing sensor histidine kinase [Pseudohongiellaceae bacterium]|nr:HAMP domain-containing sensor histidine kinase [Pseudohongiellaceae bacterium]